MSQQQAPNPPMHQGPNPQDSRWEQIQNEMRQLRNENNQLRGQVDTLTRVTAPPRQQEPPLFDAKLDDALTKKFQAMITPLQNQFQQATGMMMDRTDAAEFQVKYRGSRYDKYLPSVEQEMADLQARGQWAKREDILQRKFFEDTGKKVQEPQAQPLPEANQPKFDTYTNQWVDNNNQVVPPPTQVVVPQEGPPAAAPQQQVAQAPPPPGYSSGYQPQAPQSQWMPQLPSQTPPPNSAPGAQTQVPRGLSLELALKDDSALNAWADKYGDQPL